jgi:hypothetical protein
MKLELIIHTDQTHSSTELSSLFFLFIFSLEVLAENTTEGVEITSQNIESPFSKDPIVETVTIVEDIEPLSWMTLFSL